MSDNKKPVLATGTVLTPSSESPTPTVSLDREPSWGRFFPGRYNEKRVVKYRGNTMVSG